MEEGQDRIVSPSTETGATEGRMLGAGLVREIIGRKERGEGRRSRLRPAGPTD
jgi:hypothetical protein